MKPLRRYHYVLTLVTVDWLVAYVHWALCPDFAFHVYGGLYFFVDVFLRIRPC